MTRGESPPHTPQSCLSAGLFILVRSEIWEGEALQVEAALRFYEAVVKPSSLVPTPSLQPPRGLGPGTPTCVSDPSDRSEYVPKRHLCTALWKEWTPRNSNFHRSLLLGKEMVEVLETARGGICLLGKD